MAGADSGEAGTGACTFAGSSRGGAAWTAEGRIDEGDAVSVERREPVRRGRRGGGSGAGDLVVETAALGVENSRDDGNSRHPEQRSPQPDLPRQSHRRV